MLASRKVSVHVLNESPNHLATGIRQVLQTVQMGAELGLVDCCVDAIKMLEVAQLFH